MKPLMSWIIPTRSRILESVEGGGVFVVQEGVRSLSILLKVNPGSFSTFNCLSHLGFEADRPKVTSIHVKNVRCWEFSSAIQSTPSNLVKAVPPTRVILKRGEPVFKKRPCG